jgi:hypothetical protein
VYLTDISDPTYVNKRFFKFPRDERQHLWHDIFQSHFNVDLNLSKTNYLCGDHFKPECFTNTLYSRLHKCAFPSFVNISIPKATPQDNNNYLNVDEPVISSSQNNSECIEDLTLDNENLTKKAIVKRNLLFDNDVTPPPKRQRLSKNTSNSILASIGVTRVKNLTPRKKKLYFIHKKNALKISKLQRYISKQRTEIKPNFNRSKEEVLHSLGKGWDPVARDLLSAQISNSSKERYSWTAPSKVFALALYKRGPKAYRFLKNFMPLPSKNTLADCLKSLPLQTGINNELLSRLKRKVLKMKDVDKYVSLVFDEIQLSKGLQYCAVNDEMVGCVDLGRQNRSNKLAKHALVFLIQGLHLKFKQPIVYYFTENSIPSIKLKEIIAMLIEELQGIGFKPVATICDQGSTNRKAISDLIKSSNEPFFSVNGQKIYALYDPPHLLKNTRNALYKYNILFDDHKLAKFEHIKQCFDIDKTRTFQMMRGLREIYFKLGGFNPLKMKVSVAAKTLSYTVAAAIESMCSSSDLLPAEAIITAEFIGIVDRLWDSFCGSGKMKMCKPLRRPLSASSAHVLFWSDMV